MTEGIDSTFLLLLMPLWMMSMSMSSITGLGSLCTFNLLYDDVTE